MKNIRANLKNFTVVLEICTTFKMGSKMVKTKLKLRNSR